MSELTETIPDKADIIGRFRTHTGDTGSPEVQVALLSARIKHLTEHLKSHKKDNTSRRGLLMMVGKRSRLLRYLWRQDPSRHDKVVQELGIRSTHGR
ncbi:MAG: 30S ribosomal protein S15 [Planctomycetota bacterium]